MIDLEDDVRDALAETFNMALGDASVQFAELVNEEIELTVPEVELVRRADLACRLGGAEGDVAPVMLCRISQDFHSLQADIRTQAVLLFPESGSLEIVRRMLGDTASAEQLNELEQDALAEIGNIIINSCMNCLAHVFDREMNGSLPEVRVGPARELFAGADEQAVLLARIGMRMASKQVSGHVLFMMDLPSLQRSIEQVRRFFDMEALAP